MVNHSVYFWLNDELTPSDHEKFEQGLRALFSIGTVQSGSFGKAADTPARPVTNNDFHYSLHLQFASVEDHNSYQVDPDHDVFVDSFGPWFKEVRVFDTETAS